MRGKGTWASEAYGRGFQLLFQGESSWVCARAPPCGRNTFLQHLGLPAPGVHSHPSLMPAPLPPGGEYFSDEQMRFRAPLLYEQYIGQYLSPEELSARAPMPIPTPGTPAPAACPLSDLLLQSFQERELQRRLLQQQEEEDACLEEEDDEDGSDEEGEGMPGAPGAGP